MYNLIIKEECCSDDPYENMIILHDLSLDEVFRYIKEIEEKNSYFYEIIRQNGE